MSSFAQALQSFIPRLRQYACVLTRDRTRADDLLQSCLLKALEKQNQWQHGSDLRAWLFTIMHNLFISELRRASNAPVVAATSFCVDIPRMSQPGRQHERLVLRDLDRALDRLPVDQRTVLVLVGVEGMSYEDVSRLLRIPTGTVKSRLSRAREILRSFLETGKQSGFQKKAA